MPDDVGQVIGTTTLRLFRFVIKEGKEKFVKRDEFVIVPEAVTGRNVLGVVKEIMISNELLPDEFGRDLRLTDMVLSEGEYPIATVKVLGYEAEDGLETPRHGVYPGAKVSLAPDELIKRLLQQDLSKAAHIGSLSTRDSIPVHISINELISRHCAVLAMTGAGKSYTVGVLIEELLEKKGSIIVFDPHGEYKELKMPGSETKVFGVDGDLKIRVEVSTLTSSDYANLIPDITATQRDLLDEIVSIASRFYDKYDLKNVLDLLSVVYDMKNTGNSQNGAAEIFPPEIIKSVTKKVSLSTIGALMRRLRRLERMGVFNIDGTSLDMIVAPNQLSVINLSEADERISETIIAATTRNIFDARKRFVKDEGDGPRLEIPTFIVIEEAHNFAPRSMDERLILSRSILRKIAREGRKFGVGLCMVSQRPGKLDSDVLSQCNTQIIMKIMNPSDQEYIRQSVETVTEDIVRDLPSLSRGEAIVVGSAINLPVATKIRERKTKVGGGDIDFVGIWSEKSK
ncbi:MAG: ATP-binding protein [Methanobacteriota archaeon]